MAMGRMDWAATSAGRGWALLCILTCAVYANAIDNPFHYDDFHSIVENERLRSLAEVPSFFTDPTAFSAEPQNAMYRPLLLASFALNYALSGYETWSYHLLSLLLHLGCVGLVAAIGRVLLGPSRGAWWAACLFAIHPINSESLNYISSRSEIMAALFFLLAFWIYLQTHWRVERWVACIALAYACALLGKSIAIVLPAVLLAHAWLVGARRSGLPALFAALAGVALAYLAVVWKFLARATVGEPVRSYDEQVWTQVKALVFYIKMVLWPSGQSIDHQFLISDTPLDPIAALALLFVLSLTLLAWRYRHGHPAPTFFLAWFLFVLAPSSLVPLNVLVNEHRLYLPGVALFYALGYALNRLVQCWSSQRSAIEAAALVIAVGMAAATVQRNAVWASPLALWQSAAERAPLMARPHMYWGGALEERGQFAGAIRAYEHALRRDPGFAPLHRRLGAAYMEVDQTERAIALFERGVALDPTDGPMWLGLGEALRMGGRWQESLSAYQRAVNLMPDDSGAHNNLGNTYQVLERPEQALEHHLRARALAPNDAQTQVNLGNAYAMLGKSTEALEAYSKAVDIDPQYGGAWLNMASALERAGQTRDALSAYERARVLTADKGPYLQAKIAALREVLGE